MPHIPSLLEFSKSIWSMCQTRTHFLPLWGTNVHNGATLELLLHMLSSHTSWRCSPDPVPLPTIPSPPVTITTLDNLTPAPVDLPGPPRPCTSAYPNMPQDVTKQIVFSCYTNGWKYSFRNLTTNSYWVMHIQFVLGWQVLSAGSLTQTTGLKAIVNAIGLMTYTSGYTNSFIPPIISKMIQNPL
jgi:hypothetical protein